VTTNSGKYHPIWYWGHGDLHIERFEILADGITLMNNHELDIEEIAAINKGQYYETYVYVKTRASKPSGVYDDYFYIDDMAEWAGRATEELGLYDGRYITRAEFDDGATIIDGKPVDVRSSSELRVRFLTPANFLIAAQNAPINVTNFDLERSRLLKGILNGTHTLDDLLDAVLNLPKRSW
jgi:hypothetical protein